MSPAISEASIKAAALEILDLGWETADCYQETFGEGGTYERAFPSCNGSRRR